MSRLWNIDLDRPLSDKDKEYLLSRPGSSHLVRQNEDRFEGDDAEEDPGESLHDAIAKLSEKDLNAELKKRDLPTSGKLADRRTRLHDHVAEHEQDDDEEDDSDDGDGDETDDK